MMDADFGFDDLVGKKEIDVDRLLENEKMDVKIGFNEVRCMGSHRAGKGG